MEFLLKKYIPIFILVFSVNFSPVATAQTVEPVSVFPENVWGVYSWAGYKPNVVSRQKCPDIKGAPIIIGWKSLEPENGKFDFKTQIHDKLVQLDENDFYTFITVWVAPSTNSVSGTDTSWSITPRWLFQNGVPLVAFPETVNPLGESTTRYFPYYFDEQYRFYYYRMIDSLGNYICNLPLNLRQRILFIQTAEGSTGDEGPYKGTPLNPDYNITTGQWSQFRVQAWERFISAFTKGGVLQVPILTNANQTEQLNWMIDNLPGAIGSKGGMFSHGYHISDAQARLAGAIEFRNEVEAGGKTFFSRGEMDAEYKTYGWSTQNIKQALYWSSVYATHCGLSMWNLPGEVCSDDKYSDAILFFNRYADQTKPELSKRAFCALRRGLDASDTNAFPVSIYGFADKSNTQRYINIANAFSQYGAKMGDPEKATGGGMINRQRNDYNDAGWKILTGNYQRYLSQIDPEETSVAWWHVDNSIYGRFARSFEHRTGRDTMYFQLDSATFDGTADTVTFIVRYLDKENGSTWSFAYDAGDAELKTACSITCNGSGTWKVQTVTVPDAVLNRNGPRGSDIALINTDGRDDIFHMIEVEKGVAVPVFKRESDATLKSISWPDIPDSIAAADNWNDKRIPGFDAGSYTYELQLPAGYGQIPALLAQPADINATITTDRAISLYGTKAERTTVFTVTAEDGRTTRTYKVTFSLPGVRAADTQPFKAEPLITRLVYREWFNNNYIEITNPGSDSLDLSRYLVAIGVSSTPAEIIADTLSFDKRYNYYIPGRDYPTDDTMLYVPGILTDDPQVNPVIEPGGSFLIGHIENTNLEENTHVDDCDIIINRDLSFETGVKLIVPGRNTIMKNGWFTGALCLFKILNDSVRNGKKAVSDPEDFQLIDVFGTYDGTDWAPDGPPLMEEDNQWNITRKADYWKGDTLPGIDGSWGPTKEASEWICYSRDDYLNMGMSYPSSQLSLSEEIGKHAITPVTEYKSTISSQNYAVTSGYESPQEISEIPLNTTFGVFLANIVKKNEDQLIVLTSPDGTVKTNEDDIIEGDTITVTSADGINTTKYGIHTGVSEKSSDAILLAADSSGYVITHSDSAGVISGIPAGSTVAQVLENIITPEKARLEVLDDQNNLVPLHTLTADGSFANTIATGRLTFQVIAEDNFTTIAYKLEFMINENAAYAWSYVYPVDQGKGIITRIPEGINAEVLLRYIFPNEGSGIKLIDRAGIERLAGPADLEDMIVVTSAKGSVKKQYQLNFTGEILGSEARITSDTYLINQETFIIDSILLETPVDEFFNNIEISPYASVVLLDDSVTYSPEKKLDGSYSVKVTSGDGETTNIYHFNFYENNPGREAYITSDTFIIRQETGVIDSLPTGTSIEEFLAHVQAAPGATITILDANQEPVTAGKLEQDYAIKVSAEDGLTEVIYTINFYGPDLVVETNSRMITIFPNPAKDHLTIDGLPPRSTIIITNMYGSTKCTMKNENSGMLQISTRDFTQGIYFIQIGNKNSNNQCIKLIIE